MTSNQNAIIELMRDTFLRRLGDEVDVIFQYGSFLKDAAHQFSDTSVMKLLPSDFSGLLDRCRVFDQHLQEFLLARLVQLNQFNTLDELRGYLGKNNL